jgi:hypothetical protein
MNCGAASRYDHVAIARASEHCRVARHFVGVAHTDRREFNTKGLLDHSALKTGVGALMGGQPSRLAGARWPRRVQLQRNCASSTPIASELGAMPDAAFIKAGTLEDTSWLSPGLEIWCHSSQPWLNSTDRDNAYSAIRRLAGRSPSIPVICRRRTARAT